MLYRLSRATFYSEELNETYINYVLLELRKKTIALFPEKYMTEEQSLTHILDIVKNRNYKLPKTGVVYVIQYSYNGPFEDVSEYLDYDEDNVYVTLFDQKMIDAGYPFLAEFNIKDAYSRAKTDLKEYRMSSDGTYRLIKRRVENRYHSGNLI